MFHRAIEEQRAGNTAFPVWGDPNAVREVLYVEDQISAILAADASFENQIVNCAANAPITIGEAASAICEVLDWRAPIVSPPSSFQGTRFKVLDSSQFLKRTGWRPRYGLVDGLRRLYAIEYEQRQ
jgi:GDP-L-fucose synthase